MDFSELILAYREDAWLRAATIALMAVGAALLASLVIGHGLSRLTSLTQSELDDKILEELRNPVAMTIALVVQLLTEPDIVPQGQSTKEGRRCPSSSRP